VSKANVFVSFDTDHDGELYELLLAESRASCSGFGISGASDRLPSTVVGSESVRRPIREADQVIVICGEHTEASVRVGAELRIVHEEGTPYFLLWGRRDIMCTKPIGAKPSDGMYSWTRQILQGQIAFTLRNARADAKAETLRNATRRSSPTERART
jgi:hypothetical protein